MGYWEERWKQRQEPRHERVAASNAVPENPLGLGLVIVGAAALAISTFLPFVEPVSALRPVESNTLIQHGGWALIAFAVGIAATGYRVSRGNRKPRVMLIFGCVVAAILVISKATDTGLRTLSWVARDGTVDTSMPTTVAHLGIASYVAAAGVAAAFIGSLILVQDRNRAPADPLVAPQADSATEKCPDCAETVLADAKVCKHCGYRFAPT
jgi:hypothetical protein